MSDISSAPARSRRLRELLTAATPTNKMETPDAVGSLSPSAACPPPPARPAGFIDASELSTDNDDVSKVLTFSGPAKASSVPTLPPITSNRWSAAIALEVAGAGTGRGGK